MSEFEVSVQLAKIGVNMGDHAETVTRSVAVREDETVAQAAERLLTESRGWMPSAGPDPQYDWYLIVRLVEPAPEPVESEDAACSECGSAADQAHRRDCSAMVPEPF